MLRVPDLHRSWRQAHLAAEQMNNRKVLPPWVQRFGEAYRDTARALPGPGGLLQAIVPATDRARGIVRAAIGRSPIAPAAGEARDGLIDALENHLFDRLFATTSKTLVLEMGVASERGLLAGDDAEARYRFFCDCLSDPAFACQLLSQYPALVRRLLTLIALWEASTLEMLRRLARDMARIRQDILSTKDSGPLVSTEPLGDPHAGGRCVHRLTFASRARLIYKPRPVAMEYGVFTFVRWMNERGLSPDLKAARTIGRKSYGWAEHIEAAPCANAAAVRRFYKRQGANLALAYLLGATDLHYENVLAAGEYPVIVDLETLFHVIPRAQGMRGASAAALHLLDNSVTRTLLLPLRIFGDNIGEDGARGADISALGFEADQEAPFVGQGWDGWATDDMRLVQKRGTLPSGRSVPEQRGKRIAARDYLPEMTEGFSAAYDLFARNRARLLAKKSSPLDVFKGQAVRHVFRPTTHYVRLLGQSWHPSFGRDAKALEKHLHKNLYPANLGKRARGTLENAEVDDLMRGDIPYFRARLGTKTAFSPAQPKRLIALSADGWRTCRERIASLSSHDKDRQLWIVATAFVNFDKPLERRRARPVSAGQNALLAEARRIGDRLCDLAIVSKSGASWHSPMIETGGGLTPGVVGFDLYDGLSGIALFLGRLAQETGNTRYRRMAVAAMREAHVAHRRIGRANASIGAYDGVAGLAYALALLGDWFSRSDWKKQAVRLVRAHAARAATDTAIDQISGRAGFLTAALAVVAITGERGLLKALRPCALSLRKLAKKALPADADAGLAHGKSGVGLALARWGETTGDAKSLSAGKALIKRDLALAQAARRKQKRTGKTADGRPMVAWCRGGVGTATAALRLGQNARAASEDLVKACQRTLKDNSTGSALNLCHGWLGVVEFLEAAQAQDIKGSGVALKAVRQQALGRVLSGERCADHYHRLEMPGMLKGLAGTGYALLRMAFPERTPSILTLEAE